VTDRKESEKALMDFQHQLRTLASELALAEERERRSIAVDLHDRVGHTLAMCQIKVNQLQAAAGDAETADDLEKVSEWLEAAIGDTRSLIMEISPPALYELGLEAALDELCHDLQQQHHLAAELVDDGADKPLGEDARAAMYRSVRELAINAVKHAHATRLTISVQRDGDRIAVQVADDGVGFDPEAAKKESAHRASYGLFSIGERLSYLGGKMQIDSRPGRGTVVTLEAPLQKPGAGPTGTRRSTQRRGAEVKR
jgi:signal transduction histidine kinase